MIKQSDFTVDYLQNILTEWLSDIDKLKQMSAASKKVAIIDASKRLADAIEKKLIKH